jgi:type VI secretion system protein ImpE
MPAHFEFVNGGDAVGLIPTRYPGSEASTDGALCLARKTVWEDVGGGGFQGFGQRLLATPAGEHPLMDVRAIVLNQSVAVNAAGEHGST